MARMTKEYARVHHWARKRIGGTCLYCGSTEKIQAALSPDAPASRLRHDAQINCMYSTDPVDYIPLCIPCHSTLDRSLRTKCHKGHDFSKENTSIRPNGSRRCLDCHRDNEARRLDRPGVRAAKNAADREYRKRVPMTAEQKARKVELQRLRRQRQRLE